MKKFEITSVNHHLSSERKFEVTSFDTKTLESIIERLSKEDGENRRYDPDLQEIVRIADRNGEVFTGFFSWGTTISYYLVSNSNLVRRALHKSPKFIIQDRSGRKIELHIECEVSCPPGNENIVAQAFHSAETPAAKFNKFIDQCIDKFRTDDEHFIDNFLALNLPEQIENVIAGRNHPSIGVSPTYIMGLKCHTVRCVWEDGIESKPISVDTGTFDVPFKGLVERHQIIFKCNLAVDDGNKINALSRDLAKANPEEIVKNAIEDIYGKCISEDDIFDNFEAVKNILRDRLSEHLHEYGRRVAGLELRDLVLERCLFLQNIDIDLKDMKFFAADRKYVAIQGLLLTAKLANPKTARPHKDNPEGLKKRLKEVVETDISEFISTIHSGEFYSKIEKPNSEFREQLIERLNAKIRQMIDADLILKKIDTDVINTGGKNWADFRAHIVSTDGECSLEGSFIKTGDDPNYRAKQNEQEFDNEDIKKNIVRTLEAWLVRYSVATIMSANHYEPENFERAVFKKVSHNVLKAYGATIDIQNLKTEIIDSSDNSARDEAVKALTKRIVDGYLGGLSQEEINELERKREAVENIGKKWGKSTLITNSSGGSSEVSDLEKNNPLLKEVNRLLLDGNTSEDVPTLGPR